VLLLLRQQPAHGYQLVRRFESLGITGHNQGRVYRALKRLGEMGFVSSAWETPPIGPARRVFEILPAGTCALDRVIPTLRSYDHPTNDPVSALVMALAGDSGTAAARW